MHFSSDWIWEKCVVDSSLSAQFTRLIDYHVSIVSVHILSLWQENIHVVCIQNVCSFESVAVSFSISLTLIDYTSNLSFIPLSDQHKPQCVCIIDLIIVRSSCICLFWHFSNTGWEGYLLSICCWGVAIEASITEPIVLYVVVKNTCICCNCSTGPWWTKSQCMWFPCCLSLGPLL